MEAGLEDSERLVDLDRRLAGGGPPEPGAKVHQAVDVESAGVGVLRAELFVNRLHGERVVDAELLGIAQGDVGAGTGARGVALRECVDIKLLRRSRLGQTLIRHPALLDGKQHARIVDRDVQVAAGGQGDAPVGHRELGVFDRGLMERAEGRFGIKTIEERKPLIEELLGTRVGSVDLVVEVARLSRREEGDGPIEPSGQAGGGAAGGGMRVHAQGMLAVSGQRS